jgi:outer membrane protein OmpA-like peptidoglycan-associated protein
LRTQDSLGGAKQGRQLLQALCAIKLRETSIKRAKREVRRSAGAFKNQTAGNPAARVAIAVQRNISLRNFGQGLSKSTTITAPHSDGNVVTYLSGKLEQCKRGGPRVTHTSSQLASRFFPYGKREDPNGAVGYHKIAEIFFPTDHAHLDVNDMSVLDTVAEAYGPSLRRPPVFYVVGHADKRGTDDHNYRLGLRRAHVVDAYVASKLRGKGHRFINVQEDSRGELEPAHQGLAYDRRVDVYSSILHRRPHLTLAPEVIVGRYIGPLSNRFKIRTLIGGGVGILGAAAQVFSIEIENSRTGKRAAFTYTGGGGGMGIQINLTTNWSEIVLPDGLWLDVDDFEGPGLAHSVGAGLVQTELVFDGPKERKKANDSLSFTSSGLDLYAGISRDVTGYWHKR